MILRVLTALPDRDDAREWAEQELSDPAYREAEPTLFDRVAQAIGDVIANLFTPQIGGAEWSPLWTIVIVAIAVAAIVVAFVIWGLPRGERRHASRPSAELFDDDARSAAELRTDADAAAAREDWDAAVVLRFRAIARGIDERGVLFAPPGMTARAFSEAAREYFPPHASDLAAAASRFDDVRYLRRRATRETAQQLAGLDRALASARPAKAAQAVFT
ncbi:DUF4129 domain-containing protein [Microbacterium sp. G2-8]|uniref:DUF4129 domain-containing protein n=1 Tax=Microbacterium sp. G2-8 TaxID=2842454 RepID=UPI001C89E120|nr:DUF4129 domain-containing protein [Microbacterium sp. G2-8]